jgi:hypothetical protein
MASFEDIPILPQLAAIKANDFSVFSDKSVAIGKAKKVPAALAAQGFTHAFRIDYDNAELAANVTDDLDESITLMAIPANSLVDKARIIVTTAFAGLTACNITVGRTADPDGYIAATSALAVIAAESSGAEIDGAKEVDFVTASDQSVVVVFDPGVNTEALGTDLTAGSVIILLSLTEAADYALLTTAE